MTPTLAIILQAIGLLFMGAAALGAFVWACTALFRWIGRARESRKRKNRQSKG